VPEAHQASVRESRPADLATGREQKKRVEASVEANAPWHLACELFSQLDHQGLGRLGYIAHSAGEASKI
jgi:hypothetical protein